MRQSLQRQNPFRALIQPEIVLAAVESSEPLSRLNRHQCRPLDRPGSDGAPSEGATHPAEGRPGDHPRNA